MGHDEALLGRVRALLSDRTDVAERRIIGGISVMAGGHMCCGAFGNRLMVRVGHDAYESVLLEPHVQPPDWLRAHRTKGLRRRR
ncbi:MULTISPECIES: TfoX/Sxy family protein [unclassified Brevundimonas]|uniref:TfoX/Sxy family protein n=1 Tax=unclassified Brevundimonas TaxID=2622653 RepID=UPI003917F199